MLFGALNASRQAGPAPVISWPIGAIMILFIALVYAELSLGHGTAVVLMAIFVVINYFGVRWFARVNNVPLAVIGSVLITAVIYVALQAAFIGALDPSVLTKSGTWANLQFANDFGAACRSSV